jgi:hypothetical protein
MHFSNLLAVSFSIFLASKSVQMHCIHKINIIREGECEEREREREGEGEREREREGERESLR